MPQASTAQERMMKVQEALMRAVSREISWIQAADILGCTPRSLRRWKIRYRQLGMAGLVDGRTRGHRSPRWVKPKDLEPLLAAVSGALRGLQRAALLLDRPAHARPEVVVQLRPAGEHILAYSPQARGRGERVNRTLQGRLVNELRIAGIRTIACANRYLDDVFLPNHNVELTRPPADPASAFVTAGGTDLDQICCHEELRTVGRDNTVPLDGVPMQITKQPGRPTCAGLEVVVRRHLDGTHSIWRGSSCWGRFDAKGRPSRVSDAAA